jgi:hypothetical protein
VYMVQYVAGLGFQFIDCQTTTEHLKRFGAREIPRREFLSTLAKALSECVSPGRDSKCAESGPGSKDISGDRRHGLLSTNPDCPSLNLRRGYRFPGVGHGPLAPSSTQVETPDD